jgi:hypothetical protein
MFCSQCGTSINESHRFCSACGRYAAAVENPRSGSPPQPPIHIAAKGFGQIFGIDPRIIFLTFIVDVMLNAGEIVSLGLLVPVSVAAGLVLGYITYRAQMGWYGDDHDAALTKAIILALLTAIPTALPAIVYVPSGVVGLIHNVRKKLSGQFR